MISVQDKKPTPGEPLLAVERLSHTYRKGSRQVHALREVSLEIHQGEFVAITGPSGSGKSSLLSFLGLLNKPSRGTYRLLGRDVISMGDRAASATRNAFIGFVFQSFHLIPHLKAWKNVALPLQYSTRMKRLSAREQRHRALTALEAVGMHQYAEHLPRELSGGQEQRVAIARALIGEPQLILADEPTGNLDSGSRDTVLDLLSQANQHGVTVVMVTHDTTTAARAKRRITLHDGQVTNDQKLEQTQTK